MFAALSQIAAGAIPQFETKKALLIVNCQNDAFYQQDDFFVTRNPEFLRPLRRLIPLFRRFGDVIWVCTYMGVLPSPSSPDSGALEQQSTNAAVENREARKKQEAHLEADLQQSTKDARESQLTPVDPSGNGPLPPYDPSSRTKRQLAKASADIRSEKRSANLKVFNTKDDVIEEQLLKPRKGQQSRFFIAGTKGAEICDELLGLKEESDLVIDKHFYSAFDQTSLLTVLRSRLITDVYLCGGLTNVSIYSSAADAVQHGLGVSVIEDCLGWRSEEKHDESLRQMADIMGVQQLSSEEIIEEAGGDSQPSPSSPKVTLQNLSLDDDERRAQAALVHDNQNAGSLPPPRTQMEAANGHDAQLHRTELSETARNSPKNYDKDHSRRKKSSAKLLGPGDSIGSGDCKIILRLLEPQVAESAFVELKKEVDWQTMGHRGGAVPRLVAVQGEIGISGEVPIYRHPADESPSLVRFSPAVAMIRRAIERLLQQEFNHVLIQLYRNGEDNISEHADKTLDIVSGSNIVNVSLGAQRAMTLRMKRGYSGSAEEPIHRNTQKILMPHNSIFVLGPESNRKWLHGVRADKRPAQEKHADELAFGQERISLTFRHIGTFINEGNRTIWGTGSRAKHVSEAHDIIDDDPKQLEAMINAFGRENHQPDFDWDQEYGRGFDIVDLAPKSEQIRLILCTDAVANIRVELALRQCSIPYTTSDQNVNAKKFGSLIEKPWIHGLANTEIPTLNGLMPGGSPIQGDLAILIQVEKYMRGSLSNSTPCPGDDVTTSKHLYSLPQLYSGFADANELLYLWYELKQCMTEGSRSSPTYRFSIENQRSPTLETSLREELRATLQACENHLINNDLRYIVADDWNMIDCAFWPVLHSILTGIDVQVESTFPNLFAYYHRALGRDFVRDVIRRYQ